MIKRYPCNMNSTEVTGIDEIWHQEAFVEWSDEAQGESMHTVVILAVER
jgi:hypothetical protein